MFYVQHKQSKFCQVESIGQPIVGILGEIEKQAREAASPVKVIYKTLPPILTIKV